MFARQPPEQLNHLPRRSNSSPTGPELSSQWSSPGDILSLLLIVGSDVVQAAIAQLSGGLITPVCFSFGWVGYAFSTLAALAGTGRLMPDMDFPCKVFNLSTGYVRENRSWVVGRVLRDASGEVGGDEGMFVTVFEAREEEEGTRWPWWTDKDRIWYISLVVMMLQLGIASIPWAVYDDWGVFMVTLAGTVLALATGALPQWKVEKLAARTNSKKLMALTAGNGSRHILIFKGHGASVDIEDLASAQGPKDPRSWLANRLFSRVVGAEKPDPKRPQQKLKRKALMFHGLPLGVWFTRVVQSCLLLCWIALLISTSGLKTHTWFLVCVGAIGMLQNSIAAAVSRGLHTRGLYFREIKHLRLHKVMDALMDLEVMMPGKIRPLLDEYFPAALRPEEQAWWAGQRDEYDELRSRESERRGIPATIRKEAVLF